MNSLNIALSEPMRRFVRTRIEDGAYLDESDYIRDLIRRDQRSMTAEDRLRIGIEQGVADADAGRVASLDAVFDRLEAKYRTMADAASTIER